MGNEQFAQLFDATPMPSVMLRRDDLVVVAVNRAYVETFGWSRDELVGRSARDVEWAADAREQAALIAQIERSPRVRKLELHGRRRTGEACSLLVSVEAVTIDGVAHLLAVLDDVTELRASEERFAKAFHANPLPATIVRLSDGKIVAANDACLKVYGRTREALIGRTAGELDCYVEPGDRDKLQAELARKGSLRDYEIRYRTGTGAIVDTLTSIEFIDLAGERSMLCVVQDVTERKRIDAARRASEEQFSRAFMANPLPAVIVRLSDHAFLAVNGAFEQLVGVPRDELVGRCADSFDFIGRRQREDVYARVTVDGTVRDLELTLTTRDGRVRTVRSSAQVVEVAGERCVLGVLQDITEQRMLEAQIRQAQKLESMGLLAGGIAHDFNNVLAVISACNGLLAEAMPREHPNRDLVEDIDAAVARASALTRQLLAFSRKQVVEPKVLDLNMTVNETRKMLRRLVGDDIVLTTSLEPDLGRVRVDPGYLVQVLMNLAVNARDAMPRGGTLSITTRNASITAEHASRHPRVRAGAGVMIEVADSGVGMTPDVIAHMFEPFFTTKEHGKGTGMGLAVVHGIVEQAGGFIEVESEVGVGTTFRVYLPAVDAEADQADISAAIALGSETILVVDDDDYVRRSAARALRARGYQVIEAGSGALALEQLESGARVDLLLTDVVMPGMDGRQLAEAARARFPELRVLYTSGYTDDSVVRHGVMHGEVELIEKPFRIDALAKKVRQVLDQEVAANVAANVAADLRPPHDPR